MTDIKKKQTGKSGAKAKKLQVNKETLKDLSARKSEVKGGVGPVAPSVGCTGNSQCYSCRRDC